MFEEYLWSKTRSMNEETSSDKTALRAEFINYIKDNKNWKYNPQHNMREFAFVPKKGEISYTGFKADSFNTYIGNPLIFSGTSDTADYCYLDNNNNVKVSRLGKKTTLPLSGGIASIKTLLQ